jgi:hypothetical protein
MDNMKTDDFPDLLSDKDSLDSTYTPTKRCQHLYDILKFFGVIIYQVMLCLSIAYYVTSNFASQYLLAIYQSFLFMRPIVILCYSIMSTFCEYHKVKHAHGVLHGRMMAEVEQLKQEREEKNRKLAGLVSFDS